MPDARTSSTLSDRSHRTSPALAQLLPADAVLDALKVMLSGASLNEVLMSITRLIEARCEGVLCSIFLLDEDGVHLRYGVAANVTEAYRAATDGVCIGPHVGSCGAAAYLRQPVFISDMLSHPNWHGFREVILQSGLQASWSVPILSKDSTVLGTFCMYHREVRHPSPDDTQLIDYGGRIAGVAIERYRAEEDLRRAHVKLRESEEDLRRMTDAIPHFISVLDPKGKIVYSNQVVLDYSGLSLEAVVADNYRARIFHADDLERTNEARQTALRCGAPFELELRARRKDGQYRWILIRYNPFRNEAGHIIRWYATGTDIEDRKQIEERVQEENLALREEIDHSSMFEEIVGSSEGLRKVLKQLASVAPADSTVLILGETGTGKELIARAIHKRSKRSARAFIRVNCAAIPSSLIASELFGHEKGAFTGAMQRRLGRFELANGGTIFLDEVGDLPPDTQVALLRVLQEREFERVGGAQPVHVDVRVLAATHRNLSTAIANGSFREDLFYRLNVFPIEMPPLRERKDDMLKLVEYFVKRYARKAVKSIRTIEKRTLERLRAYDWPGNIRELQNIIERSVILSSGEVFAVDDVWLRKESSQASHVTPLAPPEREPRTEREIIEAALVASRGRVSGPSGAAARLQIPPSTLEHKIRALKIRKSQFKFS